MTAGARLNLTVLDQGGVGVEGIARRDSRSALSSSMTTRGHGIFESWMWLCPRSVCSSRVRTHIGHQVKVVAGHILQIECSREPQAQPDHLTRRESSTVPKTVRPSKAVDSEGATKFQIDRIAFDPTGMVMPFIPFVNNDILGKPVDFTVFYRTDDFANMIRGTLALDLVSPKYRFFPLIGITAPNICYLYPALTFVGPARFRPRAHIGYARAGWEPSASSPGSAVMAINLRRKRKTDDRPGSKDSRFSCRIGLRVAVPFRPVRSLAVPALRPFDRFENRACPRKTPGS